MIKLIVALLIAGNISFSDIEEKKIDIFYMYSVEDGSYWLDPESDTENVIWIDNDSLKEWGIDSKKLHHGNKFEGVFTPDGWELIRIENKLIKEEVK